MRKHLLRGVAIEHGVAGRVLYRALREDDDLNTLTELLHAAYAPLAQAGMRFVASHQSVDVTRERVERGLTIVAVRDEALVGTITLATILNTAGSPFYDRPDVASVGQFAVAPSLQNQGIGSMLLDIAERCAIEDGAAHLALDTSEHAGRLIAFYETRGFEFVEHIRYSGVNYRSVVMAKHLV
jgi:GNAT superfamily N-acetyltransferase